LENWISRKNNRKGGQFSCSFNR